MLRSLMSIVPFSRPARFACAPLLLAAACGGTTPTRVALPASEQAIVRHLPADTWAVARFDARAMRSSPHYDAARRALERDDPSVAQLFDGLELSYVAVGGFRAIPMPSSEEEEVPDYVRKARAMGGRLPHIVVTLTGPTADDLCDVPRLREPGPDIQGFRTGQNDEFAVAVRTDLCVMTFLPFLEETLAGHDPVSSTLRLLGPVGDASLYASGGADLESEGFRDLLAATAADVGDGRSDRIRRSMEAVFAGVHSGSGAFVRSADGYRFVGRMVASDAGRGVMWRELHELTLQLVDIAFEEADDPEMVRARRLLEGWTIEPTDDGYATVLPLSDDTVDSMVASFEAGASDAVDVPVSVAAEPWLSMSSGARENLEAYDAVLAEHGQIREDQRVFVELSRARSLAQLARYDEARRALTALRTWTDGESPEATDAARGQVAVASCEVELAAGDLDAALGHAARGIALAESAGELVARDALLCRVSVRAARGEFAIAASELTDAELRFSEGALRREVARAELELALGHPEVVRAMVRSLCADRSYLAECIDASALACAASLATTPRPDDAADTCRRVLEVSAGGGLREEAAHLGAVVGACEASVAARAVLAPDHCDDAAARIRDAGAGDTEFALRLARARAAYAELRGDADEARELRAEADRILAGLPATHRARVSPRGARAGGAPTRGRPAAPRRP